VGATTTRVTGTGTVNFQGNVTGGLTFLDDGTANVADGVAFNGNVIGNGGSTGSVTGAITNNASLAFNRSDAFTASNTISGTGIVSQIGTGAVTLSGSNSYSGGTVISSGTLIADNANSVGTNTVTVSGGVFLIANGANVTNTISLTGGSLAQQTAVGAQFSALKAYQGNVLGGLATQGSFLGGTSSAIASVQGTFGNTSSASNDAARIGQVLSLTGVPVVNLGTGETDVFVLQLAVTGLTADSFLAWYNSDTNTWVNAVLGNYGGTMFFAGDGAYDPLTDFNLGTYGVDTATGTVWAVLNHNSDFAVVPEPSTCALLALGLGTAAIAYRRRMA